MPCMDCKKETYDVDENGDTTGENYFMVKNKLWKSVTKKKERDGFICIECFEKRLDRKLKRNDFTKAETNEKIRSKL